MSLVVIHVLVAVVSLEQTRVVRKITLIIEVSAKNQHHLAVFFFRIRKVPIVEVIEFLQSLGRTVTSCNVCFQEVTERNLLHLGVVLHFCCKNVVVLGGDE